MANQGEKKVNTTKKTPDYICEEEYFQNTKKGKLLHLFLMKNHLF